MLQFFAYAEIIFAHILVFHACSIEVQHNNENSLTDFTVFYSTNQKLPVIDYTLLTIINIYMKSISARK